MAGRSLIKINYTHKQKLAQLKLIINSFYFIKLIFYNKLFLNTSLGIIQGRLSPYTGGKIQSFPKNTWEDEFILAKKLGLNTIELCLDSDDWEKNPIWTVQGTNRIKELTKATIRCVPFDRKEEEGICVLTGKPSSGRVLFAKAY